MKTLEEMLAKLPPRLRAEIDARAAQLIAEEMTLRELRRARKLTQVRMAKALGISQDQVSRLEQRTDLHLSTLQGAVRALGGELSLVARFPDRAPVVLSGLGDPGAVKPKRRAASIRPPGKDAAATPSAPATTRTPPAGSRRPC
jgi:transcriptional regulator with XRE-family HTH domain